MRLPWMLCLCALATAPAAGQAAPPTWQVHLGAARDAFAGASADTSTIPGVEVEVRPASRLALAGGLTRRLGAWELSLELGYASGALRAVTDALELDDRTSDVVRYRAALFVARRLAALGPTTLTLLAGPAVDHWEVGNLGRRTTLAVHGGLALRMPLGGSFVLENRLLGGVGPSPFRRQDLPPDAKIRSLRTLSYGAALRIGL